MNENKKSLPALTIGALGVVYGDLGTSPLYSVRECIAGLPVNADNILGMLSLIFWTLIIVISTKYLIVILRADNDGEGGILALLALLKRQGKPNLLLFLIGVLGASLLIGDGMLTPAMSVVSAIEGLETISPHFGHLVLPLTFLILFALFMSQRFGPSKLGEYFGPVILLWFMTIAVLGLYRILQNPEVLRAVSPHYAFEFFYHGGWHAYVLLGGIFLVVTGGEALYADLGYFGKRAIRMGWFSAALPALLLNYFGQGAYLLQVPAAISNPFYAIAPPWFGYPLLILATLATIIASQAVISATFSLTKQAILLDLCPRMPIIQTSPTEIRHVYISQMNWVLAIGTLLLIFTFKTSNALANAYGIAVNLVMITVTILVIQVARRRWHWSFLKIFAVFAVLLFIDAAFLGANAQKIKNGGWVPLLFAALMTIVMLTWYRGIGLLRSTFYTDKIVLKDIVTQFTQSSLHKVPNLSAIFITDPYDQSGGGLLHYLKLNRILPELVLIVSIKIDNYPYIPESQRFELTTLVPGIYRVILHYGFMQPINVPKTLKHGIKLDIFPFKNLLVDQAAFLVQILNLSISKKDRSLFFYWQKKLFSFFLKYSSMDIEFLQLPYNRTIAVGTYCKM